MWCACRLIGAWRPRRAAVAEDCQAATPTLGAHSARELQLTGHHHSADDPRRYEGHQSTTYAVYLTVTHPCGELGQNSSFTPPLQLVKGDKFADSFTLGHNSCQWREGSWCMKAEAPCRPTALWPPASPRREVGLTYLIPTGVKAEDKELALVAASLGRVN